MKAALRLLREGARLKEKEGENSSNSACGVLYFKMVKKKLSPKGSERA